MSGRTSRAGDRRPRDAGTYLTIRTEYGYIIENGHQINNRRVQSCKYGSTHASHTMDPLAGSQ